MTNYPLTDPAEIAKLPPAYYLCVDGTTATRRAGTLRRLWSVEGSKSFLIDVELAKLHGGIAAQLVPEQDWPPVMQDMIEEVKVQQTQRDRAVELLREVLLQSNDDWWYKDMRERIQAFLARHDSPREVVKDASGNWITRPLVEQETNDE